MLVVRWLSRTLALLLLAVVWGVASLFATTPSTSSQDFGTVTVNTANPPVASLTYQVSGLSSAPVFSLQYGVDFSLGVVNCVGTVTATCSLPVSFGPKAPGLRQDAVHVLDNGGGLLATILLHGIGSGPQVFVGPGLISTFVTAALGNPQGLAVDSAGNLYISDSLNQVVLKVNAATKAMTTVAGNGVPGLSGDGGLATRANLKSPSGITVDAAGNLYIADTENNRVRKVDAISGIITTVAGNGGLALGDGGPAVSASLSGPSDVAVDPAGNLFIADSGNNRIREVDGSGTITTAAGGGTPASGTDGIGNGGPATNAILAFPSGIALDAAGNLYIADTSNHLIRKVSNGMISVVAGTGAPAYGGDGGLATNASLNEPTSIRVDAAGDIYIADLNNNAIREVNAAGMISTIAGLGTQFGSSGNGGPANTLVLKQPSSVAVDSSGNVYIADQGNATVRWITAWSGSLTFPTTNIGQVSTPQVLSISNIGNQVLNFSAFNISGSFVQQSSGASDCSVLSPLVPGTACGVAIAFAPQVVGPLAGSLAFTTTSPKVIGLTGTGAGIPGSDPAVNATSLNFSNQAVGVTSSAQIVTVSNPGSSALALGATISGSNATEFAIAQTCVTLSAHSSCNVSISFTPAGTGLRSATLTLVEGAGSSGSQVVFLTGTGGIPDLQIAGAPVTLDFGLVSVGDSKISQLVISNLGTANFAITSLGAIGAEASEFKATSECASLIKVGASCTIHIEFKPGGVATRTATLSLYGGADAPTTVSLFGTGMLRASAAGVKTGELKASGDFDGDGKTDLAVWRPWNGTWYVLLSSQPATPLVQQWGITGDIPIPGDYDGDGKTDFAVWRPWNGTWYVLPSSHPTTPLVQQWGLMGDIPVPGDYDGDGKTDFAVWRPWNGTWYVLPSSHPATPLVQQWGLAGDVSTPGDYDGDGNTDFAVWRPSSGTWYVLLSSHPNTPLVQQWGLIGDVPVQGDYDGDGKTDFAVWRPWNGTWYAAGAALTSAHAISATVTRQWGLLGDAPI